MDSGLKELKRLLESAVDGMSSEQLSWHPENKWCASEVLEHLYLTYTVTIKKMERVLQDGKPLATPASTKQRLRSLVVLGFNYLPSGRNAPPMSQPKGLPAEPLRNEVGEKIIAMDAVIAQCEGRFGRNSRLLDHPILGPLTAAQRREFHLLHGRHHQKQILLLRKRLSKCMNGGG